MPQPPGYAQPLNYPQQPPDFQQPPTYAQATGYPPYGQAPTAQYANVPPSQPAKPPTNLWPMILVGLLVVALAIGGILWIQRPHREPGPTLGPVVTQTPAPTVAVPTTSAPTPEPTPNYAPGPGTYAGVLSKLVAEGYECQVEGLPDISSSVCLLRGNPESVVYVAGLPNQKLGRIAQWVTSGGDKTQNLKRQKYLIEQFLGDPDDVAAAIEAFSAGTPQKFAKYDKPGFYMYGAASGAVLLDVNDWVPKSARFPGVGMTKALFTRASAGYKCEDVKDGLDCTRSTATHQYFLRLRTKGDLTNRLTVTVDGPGSDVQFKSEFAKVLKPLGQTGERYVETLNSFGKKDGFRFVDGLMVDFAQKVKNPQGVERTTVSIATSCLANYTPWC